MLNTMIFIPLLIFFIAACNISESRSEIFNTIPKETIMVDSNFASSNQINMLETVDNLVRYQVGNPNFRGQTTVEVFGNAEVNVIFELNSQKDHFHY